MKTAINSRKAFTLIELMVVVFIIGMLATIVIVTLEKGKIKSRDSKRKADLAIIASAFEKYRVDKKVYPTTDGVVCNLVSTGCPKDDISNYLYPTPADPTLGAFYKVLSNGKDFKVVAKSEGIPKSDYDAGWGCELASVRQKAGEYCDNMNIQYFQVSNSVVSAKWLMNY